MAFCLAPVVGGQGLNAALLVEWLEHFAVWTLRRRVAATPRLPRGYSTETSRGDAAAPSRIVRRGRSRPRAEASLGRMDPALDSARNATWKFHSRRVAATPRLPRGYIPWRIVRGDDERTRTLALERSGQQRVSARAEVLRSRPARAPGTTGAWASTASTTTTCRGRATTATRGACSRTTRRRASSRCTTGRPRATPVRSGAIRARRGRRNGARRSDTRKRSRSTTVSCGSTLRARRTGCSTATSTSSSSRRSSRSPRGKRKRRVAARAGQDEERDESQGAHGGAPRGTPDDRAEELTRSSWGGSRPRRGVPREYSGGGSKGDAARSLAGGGAVVEGGSRAEARALKKKERRRRSPRRRST